MLLFGFIAWLLFSIAGVFVCASIEQGRLKDNMFPGWSRWGLLFFMFYIVLAMLPFAFSRGELDESAKIGDSFGVANSVYSSVGTLLVGYALLVQIREYSLARRERAETSDQQYAVALMSSIEHWDRQCEGQEFATGHLRLFCRRHILRATLNVLLGWQLGTEIGLCRTVREDTLREYVRASTAIEFAKIHVEILNKLNAYIPNRSDFSEYLEDIAEHANLLREEVLSREVALPIHQPSRGQQAEPCGDDRRGHSKVIDRELRRYMSQAKIHAEKPDINDMEMAKRTVLIQGMVARLAREFRMITIKEFEEYRNVLKKQASKKLH